MGHAFHLGADGSQTDPLGSTRPLLFALRRRITFDSPLRVAVRAGGFESTPSEPTVCGRTGSDRRSHRHNLQTVSRSPLSLTNPEARLHHYAAAVKPILWLGYMAARFEAQHSTGPAFLQLAVPAPRGENRRFANYQLAAESRPLCYLIPSSRLRTKLLTTQDRSRI
jgi:hypothetical protein